ncbi:uncharacterized protein LOC113204893 isoform X2 [Frankliniella occidentalis]|uniref:Uncharacterized protein LOC113204893 isoform X2 n=1 Tax=Frankliniella occidentalis TaxID=133901 RepID=A0A9C6U5R2_FRAOC|nr:uncharacterized protein LOC113204893 isoform X2 [Frankliniella occidentalis]
MEAGGAPGSSAERQPVADQDGREQQVTQDPVHDAVQEDIEAQVCPPDLPDDDDEDADDDDQQTEGPVKDNHIPTEDEPDQADPDKDQEQTEQAAATVADPDQQVSNDKTPPPQPRVQDSAPAKSRLPVTAKRPTAPPTKPTSKPPMRRAPPAPPHQPSRKSAMMRINQQPSHHQDSFGDGIRTGPSDIDSDSEVSDAEHFLAKGAFLLTPSHELSLEKASAICERMNFNAPFSLTKTATGILFKFARPEDFMATFKKGFHKVTGARFYKKIPIPCRPQKTFTVFVLEVPEEVPEEDIRHALYKFHSVVEVVRLVGTGGPQQLTLQKDSSGGGGAAASSKAVEKAVGSTVSGSTVELGSAGPPPLIRVTLANLDEYNILLQNGLDFYGATFFPTEAASPSGLVRLPGAAARKQQGNRILDVVTASGQRVRDLLPVFDSAGFSKIPPPVMKTIKPLKH